VPLGPLQDDGSQYYKLGIGADLDGDISIPGLELLSARASLGYVGLPVNGASEQVTIASLGLGPALSLSPAPRLGIEIAAGGGYAILVGPTDTLGNPFAQASLRASYALSPSFSLDLGASYRMHFNATGFDYQGLGLALGASFALGRGPTKARLEILELGIKPIFPVFYKYYDTNPAGTVRIKNGEPGPVKNLSVSFVVPQFMAGPKVIAFIPELKAGEERELPVYALFTDSIIGITEDTKVEAKVLYSYGYLDAELKGESNLSLRIYNRNAMTWDDNRHAAAFVSPRDPQVLAFAKTAAAIGRDASQVVNTHFRQAMGIFQALGVYGIRYVPVPSPLTDPSQNLATVDYLQFPAQTLAYKSGNCAALSICYSAMLESTGVSTAFITIPGHILIAFDLGMSMAEARALLSRPEDLIDRSGSAWVPVETTIISEGFLTAWKTGAQEWREAGAQGKADFYPLAEAWRTYEASAFVGGQSAFSFPAADAEVKAFTDEASRFVDAEVKAREPAIQKEILASAGKDPRSINKLGILYARYSLYDKALSEFTKAAMLNYGPAMVNLGNVSLVKPDYKMARFWFEKALALDSKSVPALVGLTRACQADDDGASAAGYFAKLKYLDPKTADRYATLVPTASGAASGAASGTAGGTARAAQAGDVALLWNE
jgi:tetratricopeptide (TPR) repeat protein